MINDNYIVSEESLDDRIKLSDVRIGKISRLLTEKKPSLIPFNYTFPIIDPNAYQKFLEETMKEVYFEDLPRFIKQSIYIAEKVNYYNIMFLGYLKAKDITEKEFKSKNPKTKQDIFYDFLFSHKLDIGIIAL